ncbi:hypothetical protein STSP2_03403 [Anaerohalosphaera lusitana]|uniref:Uncharacterized protein n=1 Tax=Anaerohalosphaera lusitana TaxID=1936003 RepID=A0A1U9NR50_9BACT|nr:hypothetical protein [Anaerohalosphaera lusitana]AQT70198.1 hypothetical protein STSP2_03403 [Anaerohalosphaera lusitana]
MKFTGHEIELARQIKEAGIEWTPEVGQYVFDTHGIIDKPSPFQDHVYFILSMSQFVRIFGSAEEIAANCVWLPTWEQCRQILERRGVTNEQLMENLRRSQAIEKGNERTVLYELILQSCRAKVGG